MGKEWGEWTWRASRRPAMYRSEAVFLEALSHVRRVAVTFGSAVKKKKDPSRKRPAAPGRKGRERPEMQKAPARKRAGAFTSESAGQLSSSDVRPRVTLGSTGTPGPIVVEKVTFFR